MERSQDIVKFEISDRIRNCHLYGSLLEDNYKAHSIERSRPSGLETYAIFRLDRNTHFTYELDVHRCRSGKASKTAFWP